MIDDDDYFLDLFWTLDQFHQELIHPSPSPQPCITSFHLFEVDLSSCDQIVVCLAVDEELSIDDDDYFLDLSVDFGPVSSRSHSPLALIATIQLLLFALS